MDSVCGSTFWDLNVTWYTTNPEFTECFEKTVLVWVPCLFLWSFAFLDILYIRKSRTYNIPWSFFNISKLSLLAFLIILEISNLITTLKENDYYIADILSPLLKFLSFFLAGVLIHYNRKYGIRTSGLLFLFWLFLLVCGIPQFKKEIEKVISADKNLDHTEISYFIYYVVVFLIFFLNCWVDKPPEKSDYPLSDKPCPHLSSSFISRITFYWFKSTIWKGYRKPLDSSDLWDLNYEDTSRKIVPIFDKYWQKAVNKSKRQAKEQSASYNDNTNNIKFTDSSTEKRAKKEISILPALVKGFGLSYLIASLLELIEIILIFVTPQVLSLLLEFINHKEELWKGYLYVILLFGTSSIRTILTSQYVGRLFIFGVRIRTALISAIYRKSLRMSSVAKREKTVGEIVNLMSVDCQKFIELSFRLNLVWSAPLQIIIAMYFLWGLMGPSAMAGLAVTIMLVPLNSYIANKMKEFQIKQMKLKDERVKLMNEILSGIKIIKLYAWEANFEDQISKIRKKEVKLLKKSQLLHAFSTFIFSCAPFFVSLASFATFVLVNENNVLDVQTAFVSLSLFNILRMPMILLPNVISLLVQVSVSIKRINSFMNVDELNSENVQHDPSEKVPLLIENGTFTWDKDPVLKNINLRFLHGELVAVVGTVGSGKSTLLSTFLGETNKIRGRVNVLGSTAFVPQQAWIQNASLRDNILFGKPFDRVFYERVIDACSLKTDFDILPAGDQTEIGEKGINLSGGQKQRVSLARAVYANADVYFLDDPLSAVDSHVGKHIFDNVLGPNGLLKKKTRVLVTHGATYLPDMDAIVVLKDGEVSEVGTYSELLEQKGSFADFLMQYVTDVSQQGDEEELQALQRQLSRSSISEEVNKTISRHISQAESDRSSLGGSRSSLNKQVSIVSLQKKLSLDKEIVGQKLIEKEFTAKGGVKLAIYKHYLQAVGFILCSLTLFFNFSKESFNVSTNFVLSLWSENANTITNNGTVDTSTRDMYIALYGSLGTLQGLSTFAANAIRTIGCVRASVYIHNVLVTSVMRWPLSIFDVTPLGRILNRFASDIQTVDTTLPSNIEMILSQLLKVLAAIIVITYTVPIFTTLIIPIGILYILIQRLYVATSRQLKRLESVSRSPIYSHFSETITGVATIRAYGVEQTFITESEKKVDFNQVCFYPTNVSNRWLAIHLEMIGNLIIFFASLFAILGNLNAGLVGLSISYALQITSFLNMLVRFSGDLEANIVSVERLKEYEEAPKEAAWEITNRKPSRLWPEYGNIVFNNYSTRYRTGLDLVLKNISFSIKGGEKVGIVGRTGAGKSSLTLALFRIVEAVEGEIVIDDVNISQIGLHDLRSRITIIPQEAILFSGSLRMNLDPFNEHSDEKIWNVLELSHLKSFIKGLPAGLNHEISEGGDNLSMGQKQLICLGRALLRKTKILVLDEATAAVDLETDDLIQQTIRNEFKESTVLTIAHRLNTIMDYDRIIVLDKGQLAEFDSTKSLLANKNSIFYKMAVDAGLI